MAESPSPDTEDGIPDTGTVFTLRLSSPVILLREPESFAETAGFSAVALSSYAAPRILPGIFPEPAFSARKVSSVTGALTSGINLNIGS